jgi:hypothetical protein
MLEIVLGGFPKKQGKVLAIGVFTGTSLIERPRGFGLGFGGLIGLPISWVL